MEQQELLELENVINNSVYVWYTKCDEMGYDIDFIETKLIDIISKSTDNKLELCR